MFTSNEGSTLDQFLYFCGAGLDKHAQQINQLIPTLVKEFPPDKTVIPARGCVPKRATLLHILATCPKIDYQSLFQDNKEAIDCNVLDSLGYTPLHWACHFKSAVELLLKRGAYLTSMERLH